MPRRTAEAARSPACGYAGTVEPFIAPKAGWHQIGNPAGPQEDTQVVKVTFDTVPAGTCCVCGSADVSYRNYLDQPFCWSCASPPYRMPWKRRFALAARALCGRWP
jgi:hypothetical protein